VLCNDVHLGPAPEGEVAVCVPFADYAQARFVPAPEAACGNCAGPDDRDCVRGEARISGS